MKSGKRFLPLLFALFLLCCAFSKLDMFYGFVTNYSSRAVNICMYRGEIELGCSVLMTEAEAAKPENFRANTMANSWPIFVHAGTLYKLEYSFVGEEKKTETFILSLDDLRKNNGPFEIEIRD